MKHIKYFVIAILVLSACQISVKKTADSILFNGRIITMEDSFPEASVMVIKDGKILALGNSELLKEYTCDENNKTDLNSMFVYPGLIDAHCHFYGYAKTLLACNLVGTQSWKDVIKRLDSFAKLNTTTWIIGRGWDQNDWENQTYPDNTILNVMFPGRPVVLKRIDGHAAICNYRALELAGINLNSRVEGGEIEIKNGKLTGLLTDNALDLLEKAIQTPTQAEMSAVLKRSEQHCFSMGLTCLADAGLDLKECLFLDSLLRNSELSIFLYLMLNPSEEALNYAVSKGIYESKNCRIGSFKLYADGALGSRGAKLKKDYCDRNGYSGMLLNSSHFFDSFCNTVYHKTQYQINTHCIGDSANRLILETYGKYLKPGDQRYWRIEHAQILDPADIPLFGKYHIVPSVQPTHAGSDAPWVEDRICKNRMKGAYAYQSLLKQNDFLPLGTDFPVESINPLYTFYSAVFRKNAQVPSQAAFLQNESLSPEQALKGMTIWAAKACRMDHRKGSLSIGKDADFVIMNKNLLNIREAEVLNTKIIATYCGGLKVF